MLALKLIDIYTYIVLGSVLVSWIQLPRDHPIMRIFDTLVEPALKPIRSILPASGGLDFSPIVLLFGLYFLRNALI